jgi:hypothetical protein
MASNIPNPGWKVAVCVRAKREIDLVVCLPKGDGFKTSAPSAKTSQSV